MLNYNQDAHRQRTVNWCDRTGGTSAAFDFTDQGYEAASCQGLLEGPVGFLASRHCQLVPSDWTASQLSLPCMGARTSRGTEGPYKALLGMLGNGALP